LPCCVFSAAQAEESGRKIRRSGFAPRARARQ
jgi:hypothetical protein